VVQRLEGQMAALQAKAASEVEALLARDSHTAKQVEVLTVEVQRLRGGTTLSMAALQNEELQEVRWWACAACGGRRTWP
jgi:hypothetical protein